MQNEAICYLLRKTSLTRGDIASLTPAQFQEIVKEVRYQESIEEYQQQYDVASILAAIYNTIPKKGSSKTLSASDFLKAPIPNRDGAVKDTDIEMMAEKKGIILPKE